MSLSDAVVVVVVVIFVVFTYHDHNKSKKSPGEFPGKIEGTGTEYL